MCGAVVFPFVHQLKFKSFMVFFLPFKFFLQQKLIAAFKFAATYASVKLKRLV